MSQLGRTVKLDGGKLKEFRVAKGLTAAALADRCDVSLKTVSNAERNHPVLVETVRLMAEELGIDISAMLPEGQLPPVRVNNGQVLLNQSQTPGQRASIRIVTTIEFDAFGPAEQAQFLNLLTRLSDAVCPMTITKTEAGSTIITIEMDQMDIPYLVEALLRRELDRLGVVGIIVPDDQRTVDVKDRGRQFIKEEIWKVRKHMDPLAAAFSIDSMGGEIHYMRTRPEA